MKPRQFDVRDDVFESSPRARWSMSLEPLSTMCSVEVAIFGECLCNVMCVKSDFGDSLLQEILCARV